jgi:ATP-dependent Clp protease ATP-binding subunit ClpA
LNVFDNGQMTVASGERVYNFRNTIVFMTSNLGTRDLYRHQERLKGGLGWWRALRERLIGDDLDTVLQNRLNEHFSPEFVNRIDNVTVYNWIEREMVEELVSMEVERLNRRLQKHHCVLQLDKQARSELAKRGYDRQYGARALRRVIRSHVEVPFADYLLSGGHEPGPNSESPVAYEVNINKTDVQFKRM